MPLRDFSALDRAIRDLESEPSFAERLTLCGAAVAFCAVCVAPFFLAAQATLSATAEPRFALVEIYEGDSYVLDHDLTADDCREAVAGVREAGRPVAGILFCESDI
jgi:hypothetical protein